MDDQVKNTYELIVIGGGPAGLSSAIAASEAGLERILVVERLSELGGILPQCIHTGFGSEEMTGPEYAAGLIHNVRQRGIDFLTDTTVLQIGADRSVLTASFAAGVVVRSAQTVILASGCRERPIGSLPVTGTRPAGIYTAGTAQQMINLHGLDLGERVVILGSGDVGLIMARRLTLLGKKSAGRGGRETRLCRSAPQPGPMSGGIRYTPDRRPGGRASPWPAADLRRDPAVRGSRK